MDFAAEQLNKAFADCQAKSHVIIFVCGFAEKRENGVLHFNGNAHACVLHIEFNGIAPSLAHSKSDIAFLCASQRITNQIGAYLAESENVGAEF